ncbi:helix-turn-helix domain-containing protein [Streptomyces prunicolor]|uniref:helix-turn-helix domain-containing protein n=1 Tax=Streptomyces prunicolor TaxID=67348 RepID=UPI000372D520|nr:helix-turn-helix transcriptional regulator [Streptomyces prunicolor]
MVDQEPDWSVLRRRAVGERIRTVRLHRKLTQEQLANEIGIDRRSVHRYETARRDPALSMLLRIADALDVPLELLVSGSLELDLRDTARDERPAR